MKQKPALKFQNADVNGKIYMKQHSSSNNTEGTGIKCSSLAKKNSTQTICNALCTRWSELSWIKWNDGGDLAPPPQRRRRRRPPPPPPRNLPFVTLPVGHLGSYLSRLHLAGHLVHLGHNPNP